MKNYQFIFFATLLSVFTLGCDTIFPTAQIDPGFSDKQVITITGEIHEKNGEPVVLPQPQTDPSHTVKPDNPPVKQNISEKKSEPDSAANPEKEPKTPPAAGKSLNIQNAPIEPEKSSSASPAVTIVTKSATPRNKMRRGPILWRAFTRLSPDEQKKMLELQRKDPEHYRRLLQEKAEQLYAREKARRQALDELAVRFNQTTDPAMRETIKRELRDKLKEDFMHRLQDTRQDIEAYKLRTAQLEKELQKREKNCDAIIDALLNQKLEPKK